MKKKNEKLEMNFPLLSYVIYLDTFIYFGTFRWLAGHVIGPNRNLYDFSR